MYTPGDLQRCDPCLKRCACLVKVRDRDGEYYLVCCKCITKNDYFWRYRNKRVTCDHTWAETAAAPPLTWACSSLADSERPAER